MGKYTRKNTLISADCTELLKQLSAIEEEVQRKMLHMVREFAERAGEIAVSNTPIGQLPETFYEKRQMIYPNYTDGPGMAQGAWNVSLESMYVSMGLMHLTNNKGYSAGAGASLANINAAMDGYQTLGQSFYIINTVPYMTRRNKMAMAPVDPTGSRVLEPTVQEVMQILATDLVAMYNRG